MPLMVPIRASRKLVDDNLWINREQTRGPKTRDHVLAGFLCGRIELFKKFGQKPRKGVLFDRLGSIACLPCFKEFAPLNFQETEECYVLLLEQMSSISGETQNVTSCSSASSSSRLLNCMTG